MGALVEDVALVPPPNAVGDGAESGRASGSATHLAKALTGGYDNHQCAFGPLRRWPGNFQPGFPGDLVRSRRPGITSVWPARGPGGHVLKSSAAVLINRRPALSSSPMCSHRRPGRIIVVTSTGMFYARRSGVPASPATAALFRAGMPAVTGSSPRLWSRLPLTEVTPQPDLGQPPRRRQVVLLLACRSHTGRAGSDPAGRPWPRQRGGCTYAPGRSWSLGERLAPRSLVVAAAAAGIVFRSSIQGDLAADVGGAAASAKARSLRDWAGALAVASGRPGLPSPRKSPFMESRT
jgi:hypothetical protein